ncbi:hypothetical protein BpHYR1_044507 [Brachionus plicatilis]|uniref:Uncharacterized protein n=1 Tax=Brachionus plicatilis TaxID=10195 RepID=A0A3M7SYY0_BRAPC|nr:hypothetical protein BpHYR1_044507 [Brachionus plicatilis]
MKRKLEYYVAFNGQKDQEPDAYVSACENYKKNALFMYSIFLSTKKAKSHSAKRNESVMLITLK